ncbi:MAG: SusC/RagA family TonB-linked outer membrane protein [Lewinellaceae bacterium]|nr:SusC/RagA family TonB-linked outer membrane protein [Phaeodactylibacter sp.]MCB9038409.1 SusC/RagA family TonB-linked outer membrane protein [Lewinellaceae bacterium]
MLNPEGEAMVGASIFVKDGEAGTITDAKGQFEMRVLPGDSLVLSYIGYEESVIAAGNTPLAITLFPRVESLEEVVVTGYKLQKKRELTGAVGHLSEEDLNTGIIHAPEQLMQGRLAGVELLKTTGAPGAAFLIRIRGAGSIRANNSPLYVVDGYPLDLASVTPGAQVVEESNPLNFLNPADIESIDILKDASAAAIYGARGANGVVLITTKNGKGGQPQLNYTTYAAASKQLRKIDVLTSSEFRRLQGQYGFMGNDLGTSTDWQEEISRHAFTHNHGLSLSGGSAKTDYRFSLNFLDQEGILKKSGFLRAAGRARVRHRAWKDRLSVDLNLAYAYLQEQRPPSGIASFAPFLNPTMPIWNAAGDFFEPIPNFSHAVALLEGTNDETRTNRLQGMLSTTAQLAKGLSYQLRFGGDNSVGTRRFSLNRPQPPFTSNQADISERETGNLLFEHYATFEKNFGKAHRLSLLAGHSYQVFRTYDFIFSRGGFSTDAILNVHNIGGGIDDLYAESGTEKYALQSFFGRLDYQLLHRYFLTVNFRRDGSTRFGKSNRYGNFPAFALAWNISEEPFLTRWRDLDLFKLRASWGITGNQEIPNKITQQVLGFGPDLSAILDSTGAPIPGFTFLRTPNPGLQWEETRQLGLGLDFSFSRGRLQGTVDYFDKRTSNLLLELAAASAPTPTVWANVKGEIVNRGWEFTLGGTLIQSGRFSWQANGNLTLIENVVRGLPTPIRTGFQPIFTENTQIIQNGSPLGTFYGRKWLGFDEQGYSIIELDEEGDPVFTVLGQALPNYTWGMSHTVNWGKFDLHFMLNGSHGNEIYNRTARALLSKQGFPRGNNVLAGLLSTSEAFDNALLFSNYYIEDGSYIRLNMLSLGYTFQLDHARLRLYLAGNNLALLTAYRGFDPEVNYPTSTRGRFGRSNNIPPLGIDLNAYPSARTIMLGAELSIF